jgi:4-amino-4-deoxy-L-arabinose transferase-like glycosyltransferase
MTGGAIPPSAATAAQPAPTHRPLLVLGGGLGLIGLWIVLQLWGLGSIPFHTHGEAREGLVVWQITHGGGWILPMRDGPTGIEVPSKPPLFHWMAAVVSLLHGRTDEWSIRLPSALLSLGGTLATYAAGTALWGPLAGLLGSAVVMTSFEWQRAATGARVDMTLTFGLLVALFSYLFFLRTGRSRWLAPFYGGMAFAVLAKGPAGVVLPGLVIAATCGLQRDISPLWRMQLIRGLIIVTVTAGLWYVLALFVGGFAFFHKQILNENIYPMFAPAEFQGGHRHGPIYLLGGLAAGFLPWTLFLPGPAITLWRERRTLSVRDPQLFLLSWIVIVFGTYSFAASKRSVYLLALYPALGLLVGWWWNSLVEVREPASTAPPSDPQWLRVMLTRLAQAAFGVVCAVIAVVALEDGGARVVEWVGSRLPGGADAAVNADWVGAALRQRPVQSLVFLGAAAAASWWLARALRRRRWGVTFAAMLVMISAITTFTQQVVLQEIGARQTYRDLMHAVRQVVGDQAGVFFYHTFDYGAVFYWRDHIADYSGDLSNDAPRYLLMAREDWQRATPAEREKFERVTLPPRLEQGDERRLVLVRKRSG